MSDLDLDKLAELLAAATPAPWATSAGYYGSAYVHEEGATGEYRMMVQCLDDAFLDHRGPANAAAIVALVNAAPSLLATAKRERELREKARALPRCEANRDVSGPERCGKIATHRASYRDLPVCDAHALPRDVVIEGVAAIRALAALLEEPADGE